MIVLQIFGGLGNQMFQYACGRALALRTGKRLVLDIRQCIQNEEIRPYALHNFGIQAQIIQSMDELERIAKQNAIPKVVLLKEAHFHFDPRIISVQEDVMLSGYWQSEKYFSDKAESISRDFTPVLGSLSKEGVQLAQKIQKNISIALHIRRGDYTSQINVKIHGILPRDYYRKAMDYFNTRYDNVQYYVFSDDIAWCKTIFANQPNITVVEHNSPVKTHEDLWLMSKCKHNIIANSTYSWWGAWLNANPAKIVIAPNHWFANAPHDTRDLIPEKWLKLPIYDENIQLVKKKNNKIYSQGVNTESIKGNNITIMPGTLIDALSVINGNTYIGYNCSITRATIGRYVSIANNVSIGMGEHKLDEISTSGLFYDKPYEMLTKKECIIGNDCWIGVDSIIRRGVKIGNGAVVGANSFVNNDVPDFSIVAGNPAKIIKYRFSENIINIIKESKWWDLEIEEAKKIFAQIIKKGILY